MSSTFARILVAVGYLLVSALVGYQSLQNLLPDAFLVLGGDTLFASFLNRGKPVREGVHVAWRAAFAFNPAISFLPKWQDSFFHRYFVVAK